MRYLKLKIRSSGKVLAHKVKLADDVLSRLMGLMFTRGLEGYDGILFVPGNSIQTCFMRYPIDVVFLNSEYEVIKVIHALKPWRFTWMYLRSNRVLEMAAGSVPPELMEGERLEVSDV